MDYLFLFGGTVEHGFHGERKQKHRTDLLLHTELATYSTKPKKSLNKFTTPALRMDLNSIRRVSSAGYRLPERKPRPVSAQPAAERSRRITRREPPPAEHILDKSDSVKQDQVWKDLVWNERRAVEEW